jgi:hypothetical protein
MLLAPTLTDNLLRTLAIRPAGFSDQEIEIRNLLGADWDASHHPGHPDRFYRPLSLIALPDSYDFSQSFYLGLVGTPPRGDAILAGNGTSGLLIPTGEAFSEDELHLLRSVIEVILGRPIGRIPIGMSWTSEDRRRQPVPFPSGLSWSNISL